MQKNSTVLKWIINTIKKQIIPVVLLIALNAILAAMSSVAALLSRNVIDNAVDGIKKQFFIFILLLGSIYLLHVGLRSLCRYLEQLCKAKIEIAFQQKIFSMILHKDFSNISQFHSGALLNRMTGDVTVISEAAATILPNIASLVTQVICSFGVLFYLQPWFAMLFLVCGVLVYIITRSLRTKIKDLHKQVQEADDGKRSFWQETISNLLAVRAFSANKTMEEKSGQLQFMHYKAQMKKAKISMLGNIGYGILLRIGYIAAFAWSGLQLFSNKISFGTLTAILQLVNQVQSPFVGMSGVLPKCYAALASAERLMEIEALPDEVGQDTMIDAHIVYRDMKCIDFSNVCFTYDREQILHNLCFQIHKGELISVMGQSGIGKSTLFKLLLGVYRPDSGSIFIVTGDKTFACSSATRTLFAYVPQGNFLFSGSIRENITFADPNVTEEQIWQAIKISCADSFVRNLPEGLETIVGEKGLGLSEGQVQRLAITRAVLSNAPVLLLDEATSALDEATEYALLQNLRRMSDRTCLLVTHRKQALEACDRSVMLVNGNIIEKDGENNG